MGYSTPSKVEYKWMVRTPMGDYIVWAESESEARHLVWRKTLGLVQKREMLVSRTH